MVKILVIFNLNVWNISDGAGKIINGGKILVKLVFKDIPSINPDRI